MAEFPSKFIFDWTPFDHIYGSGSFIAPTVVWTSLVALLPNDHNSIRGAMLTAKSSAVSINFTPTSSQPAIWMDVSQNPIYINLAQLKLLRVTSNEMFYALFM